MRFGEGETPAGDDVLNVGMRAVDEEGHLATERVKSDELEEAPVVRSKRRVFDAGGARGVPVVVGDVALQEHCGDADEVD